MNKIRIAGAAAGVVLVSGIVLQVSSAAFTDTTENAGNDWTAGSVYLSDSRNGVAMFSSSANIVPGYSETQCIEVQYDGTVDPGGPITLEAEVTLDQADGTGDGLANDLDVTVAIGPEGSECAGDALVDGVTGLPPLVPSTNLHDATLATFGTDAPKSSQWTPGPTTDTMRPFLFTVELPGGAGETPDDAQGDRATATFVWSATS